MLYLNAISLDSSRPTPLYLQLAEGLRGLINDGSVRVGEALPSERELSNVTHISRVTVRKAIDTLLRDGMLSRRRGSGTYVAPRIEQPASVLAGFSADMANRGSKPGSIWLDRVLAPPTPEEVMTLAIAPDSMVTRLSRVRTADDEPLAIERAVVPAALLPPLERLGDSLYAALARLGNRPVRGLQRLHASLATAREAQLLSIPVGAAILRIERRTFLASGAPVEYTRSAYRGDRYDFVTEIRDPGIRSAEESGR
ncbi:MAG: GntR family transcriptional regulator [Proteobacteria bacterium]|nr:GntR family transcriptional regulator [Pseudomonadota bacterium]